MELAGGGTTMDVIRGGRAEMVVSCVHWLVVGCDASDGMSVSPPTNSSTSQKNAKFALHRYLMNRVLSAQVSVQITWRRPQN